MKKVKSAVLFKEIVVVLWLEWNEGGESDSTWDWGDRRVAGDHGKDFGSGSEW